MAEMTEQDEVLICNAKLAAADGEVPLMLAVVDMYRDARRRDDAAGITKWGGILEKFAQRMGEHRIA